MGQCDTVEAEGSGGRGSQAEAAVGAWVGAWVGGCSLVFVCLRVSSVSSVSSASTN